jgi:acetyltransferase
VRVCFTDYDREIALVAEQRGGGSRVIAGVARLVRLRDPRDAEFSLIVSDDFQGIGLGTELMRRLVEVAREEGLTRIVADILAANGGMVNVASKLGLAIIADTGSDSVRAELRLP